MSVVLMVSSDYVSSGQAPVSSKLHYAGPRRPRITLSSDMRTSRSASAIPRSCYAQALESHRFPVAVPAGALRYDGRGSCSRMCRSTESSAVCSLCRSAFSRPACAPAALQPSSRRSSSPSCRRRPRAGPTTLAPIAGRVDRRPPRPADRAVREERRRRLVGSAVDGAAVHGDRGDSTWKNTDPPRHRIRGAARRAGFPSAGHDRSAARSRAATSSPSRPSKAPATFVPRAAKALTFSGYEWEVRQIAERSRRRERLRPGQRVDRRRRLPAPEARDNATAAGPAPK